MTCPTLGMSIVRCFRMAVLFLCALLASGLNQGQAQVFQPPERDAKAPVQEPRILVQNLQVIQRKERILLGAAQLAVDPAQQAGHNVMNIRVTTQKNRIRAYLQIGPAIDESTTPKELTRLLLDRAQQRVEGYDRRFPLTPIEKEKLLLAAKNEIQISIRKVRQWQARYGGQEMTRASLAQASAMIREITEQAEDCFATEDSLFLKTFNHIHRRHSDAMDSQRLAIEVLYGDAIRRFLLGVNRTAVLSDDQVSQLRAVLLSRLSLQAKPITEATCARDCLKIPRAATSDFLTDVEWSAVRRLCRYYYPQP